jgi:hypothetical protein
MGDCAGRNGAVDEVGIEYPHVGGACTGVRALHGISGVE